MAGNLPFTIALRPGEPVAAQVVFAVTRAVVTGQLRPGDAFPSVRTLSQELRINPNTAHRIISILTEDGILTVLPGIGSVVAASAVRSERPAGLEDEIERLVVETRRAGLTLPQVIARLKEHWSRTSRRAG